MKEMTKTKETSVTFTGAEPGKTYTFDVVAKLDELQSDPASTTVQIGEVVEEVPEVEEELPKWRKKFPRWMKKSLKWRKR